MTELRSGSATDVGRVRTNNEDNLLVVESHDLYAVADGMGGHAGGEVASLTAVEALRANYDTERTADALADAVRAANRAVWERAGEDTSLRGMGTTLTAVALVDQDGEEVLAITNVGDSRAYLLRDGELDQLTDDHSLTEELVRRGELTAEEAAIHPQKHILTRVLGMDSDVEVDCFRVVPYTGDRVLLASDGLFNELEDDQIASLLRRLADPDEAARELVRAAKTSGGNDNITVVIVDVVDDGDKAEAASAALKDDPGRKSRAEARVTRDEPTDVVPVSDAGGERRRESAGPRITGRTIAFIVALALIVGGALVAVGYYARGAYYVGLDDSDEVAIFKGQPGGLLWFDPTLEARTGIVASEVPPARLDDVRTGHEVGSLGAAERYVDRLREERAALEPPPEPEPLPPPDPATTAPATPPAPPPPPP